MVNSRFIQSLEPTVNKDTRSGFGEGLLEVGKRNKNAVALCADLTGSLKMNAFEEAFPDRFFQVGIAEANMMGVAAGMTIGGKIPFTGTFANFSTLAIAEMQGPVYLRFGRPKVPVFMRSDAPFEIGKIQTLMEGNDVTIVATGHLVWEALKAAQVLTNRGIRAEVLNVHTIKPLDVATIVDSLKRTGCAVTAEEHQRNGGLGSLVAQAAAAHFPVPIEHVAVNDSFGESGKPAQLMEKYGLNSEAIQAKVDAVMRRATVIS